MTPTADPAALWHAFLDTLSDPLVMIDAQLRITRANAAARRLGECQPGMSLAAVRPALAPAVLAWVREGVAGSIDTPAPADVGLNWLGGALWALRLPRAPGRIEAGPAAALLIEMQRLHGASPFPVLVQDEHYRIVDANDAFVRYLGRPREALLGNDPLAFVPEEDHELWLSTRAAFDGLEHAPGAENPPAGAERPAEPIERRLLDALGRERWHRGARQRLRGADGQVLRVSVLQDCTAEHAAIERAERVARELDQWFDLSPLGMLAFDGAGLVRRSNRIFEDLVGRVPVMLAEAPEDLRALLGWQGPGSLAALQPGAEATERRGTIDTAGPGPATRRPMRARVQCIGIEGTARGGEPRYIAVVEGLDAEQALDQAQAQWGALVDAAGLGVALPRVGRDLVAPESLPEFEALQRAAREGTAAQARYAIRHPTQGPRWLLTRVEPRAGAAPSVVTLDVTEQERARARNDELLRELTSILESSSAGIAFLRGNTLVRCNARFERMLGFAAGAVAGCSVRELFAGQPHTQGLIEDTEAALAEGGVYETEIEIRLPHKPVLWAALSARRVGLAEQPPGDEAEVVAVLTDITRLKRQHGELERLAGERERTEAAMSQQAELTRAILDSVFVGIVTVGQQGIEWMNRSARRMFGGDLAALRHQPLERVATSETSHPFRKANSLLLQRGHAPELPALGFECRVEALDGRSFWVVGNVVASGDTESPQLTYALLDIDRRREAEARSAHAQASLQRVIELAPLAIALFDAGSGSVRHLNPVAAALAGLSAEEVAALAEPAPTGTGELSGFGDTLDVRLRAVELPAPLGGEALRDDLHEALSLGRAQEPIVREVRVERGGQTQIWDARYLPLAAAGEIADEVLMVATDVTAQRAAEAARLEAAIAQRDMLVKEVHHRIKNNLQGVAGLLAQIAQRRPDVAPVLRDAVGQVQAIALVYGLQVGGRGPLRLASLLEAIAASLQRSSGRPIAVSLRGGNGPSGASHWALPEAEAIPVALTLNELLGNALKHGGAGAVDCTLVGSDTEARVEIRNDGRLPEGFSLEQVGSGVLGLGLVRALLPRRSATLVLVPEAGRVLACVTLRPPGLTRLGDDS